MSSATATRDCPVMDDDPFGHDILEDPHEFHRRLRDAGPLVYLSRYDVYAMGRFDQVRRSLNDWQSFQSSAGVGLANFRYEPPWRPPSLLLEADPPAHDAVRAALSTILNPRSLRGLRDKWFADAEQLVEEIADRHSVDGVTDIAQAFPLRVFSDAAGFPAEGRENLLPYSNHLFNTYGPPNDLVENGLGSIDELSRWVNDRCQRDALASTVFDGQPTFGAQIYAAADRGDITHEQAPRLVRSLISAGLDSTIHALAGTLHAFATHPDQWQRLRSDRLLVRVAFEEALRWHSPVQTFFRTATRTMSVDGFVVPDGKKILMFLGSANHDPREWNDPDRFDLSRNPSGHVGFGMGIHQCVGQHVARQEAEALLTALVNRFSAIELAGTPRVHLNNTLRGFESLPLALTTA